MKVVGIITEYNPFHKGHKYHIEEAKNNRSRLSGGCYERKFCSKGKPCNNK